MLVEVHPQWGYGGAAPTNARNLDAIFTRLEREGYYLASLEPVTYTNAAQAELVFLNVAWTPQAGWQS